MQNIWELGKNKNGGKVKFVQRGAKIPKGTYYEV